ncbi:hypothetical protein [Crocinitomix algicola]|uniref:hypothetical protein n=1 Tax=Crocinitomix algicola TaxID=1740263 RepID=UPI0008331420|nr:hypothetical protein [Crocinitomix algicola]
MENQVKMENQNFMTKYAYATQAFILVFGSCIASIAAMHVLKYSENILLLSLTAAAAMVTNALCIAQADIKITLKVFYGSLILNIAIIMFELLAA